MARPVLALLALVLPLAAVAQFDWQFPIDYEFLLRSPLDTSFSCDDRPYGYYADPANDCKIYHVCVPVFDTTGVRVTSYQYSFVCNNQTIFDQEKLTCTFEHEAFPCDMASTLYDIVNAEFGLIEKEEGDPLKK